MEKGEMDEKKGNERTKEKKRERERERGKRD